MKILLIFGLLLSLSTASAEEPKIETSGPLRYRAYSESRLEFRKNCESLSMECGSWKVPTITSQDLTIDTAYFHEAKSNRLLILVCGTHGAEAHVGCAILNSTMVSQLQQIKENGINVVFVHAANPYGFRNSRRVTENNIDLNRNFLIGDRPTNPGYQKLKANLEPEAKAGLPTVGFLKLSIKLLWRLLIQDFSLPEMRQAVASGQYESSRGLFYGGVRPEPQMDFFRELFAKVYKGQRDIVVVDIHTGLGKRGVMHLIPTDDLTEGAKAILSRILPSDGGDKKLFELTLSNTKGFYKTYGSFNDFAQQSAAPEQTVLALTMEFGTIGDDIVSQLRSLSRMVMENQGRQHGYTSDGNQYRVRAEFMELFAPSAHDWQSDVGKKASEVFSLINKNL